MRHLARLENMDAIATAYVRKIIAAAIAEVAAMNDSSTRSLQGSTNTTAPAPMAADSGAFATDSKASGGCCVVM
eukprot:m.77133 g.77133  ORF g.77133 m.77133 type:complete len:74 (-) comp7907_c0_seq2:417-638(-)